MSTTVPHPALAGVLTVAMTACAGTQTPKPGQPSGQPSHQAETHSQAATENDEAQRAALKARFEQEAPPAALQPVEVGELRGEIESDAPPTVQAQEGLHLVSVQLAKAGTVQCFVYDDVLDPATALHAMLSQASAKVSIKHAAAYPLDHAGMYPILGVRALYHAEQEGALVAGDYKVLVMAHPDHSVTCMHDAPGFAESFRRIASAFAKSLRPHGERDAPAQAELWAIELDGMPMGFSQDKRYMTDDGGVLRANLQVMFPQVSQSEFKLQDIVHIVTSNAEGEVLEAEHATVEAGKTTLELKLERTEEGYSYAGTAQGEPVQGEFKTPEPLRGTVALEQRLARLAKAGKGEHFSQWEYHPSADATRAIEVKYEVTPRASGLRVAMRLGHGEAVVGTDASGRPTLVEVPVGPRTMRMRSVERRGP